MATVLNRLRLPLGAVKDLRLVMIVRDEGHCIERCLSSLIGKIASWCIVDTGSTDDTKEKILEALKGIPGQLHERPWVDFGHNRTESLRLADQMGECSYYLTLDADEEVESWDGLTPGPGNLGLDIIKASNGTGERVTLLAGGHPWFYKRQCHEKIDGYFGYSIHQTGIVIHSHGNGGRHRNPNWQVNDLKACMDDLLSTQDTNILYHIGEMLGNMGMKEQALSSYALLLRSLTNLSEKTSIMAKMAVLEGKA